MSVDIEPPAATGAARRDPQIVFKRVRFADEPPSGSMVLTRFDEAGRCATLEAADHTDLPASHRPGDIADSLLVALLPPEAADETAAPGMHWISGSEAPLQIAVADGLKIAWRPGRAIVQGTPSDIEMSLRALARFAFCDGVLRDLERALDHAAAQARSDVALAYHIRHRDRGERTRLATCAEHFSGLRLDFVQLPPLIAALYRLAPAEQELLAQLLEKANIHHRLEAASARLQACETLYQDAIDRIAQHHWAIEGHWLEIIIIILLLLELMATAAELFLSHPG